MENLEKPHSGVFPLEDFNQTLPMCVLARDFLDCKLKLIPFQGRKESKCINTHRKFGKVSFAGTFGMPLVLWVFCIYYYHTKNMSHGYNFATDIWSESPESNIPKWSYWQKRHRANTQYICNVNFLLLKFLSEAFNQRKRMSNKTFPKLPLWILN